MLYTHVRTYIPVASHGIVPSYQGKRPSKFRGGEKDDGEEEPEDNRGGVAAYDT